MARLQVKKVEEEQRLLSRQQQPRAQEAASRQGKGDV